MKSDGKNKVPLSRTYWGYERPELWSLRRESWQMFATMTFADRKAKGITFGGSTPKKVISSCTPLFSWLRLVASALSCHWDEMTWAARLECGELGGRLHYHAIIGGLPVGTNLHRGCGIAEGQWRHALGFGICDVAPWDGRDAVSYLADTDGEWSAAEASAYEFRKFGTPDRLILGKAFVEKWRKLLHDDNCTKIAPKLFPDKVSPANPDWALSETPGLRLR